MIATVDSSRSGAIAITHFRAGETPWIVLIGYGTTRARREPQLGRPARGGGRVQDLSAVRRDVVLTKAGGREHRVAFAGPHGHAPQLQMIGRPGHLWQFTFTSTGNNVTPFFIPDGVTLDAGYAQWHSDGNEIMNSGRDPATSNMCLGTWISTGGRSYALNHFALSWDTSGTMCESPAGKTSCFVGPTNIREQITVDPRGDTYTGSVTMDQYDPDGHFQYRLSGNISATKITVN